jgi:hypothetical protein
MNSSILRQFANKLIIFSALIFLCSLSVGAVEGEKEQLFDMLKNRPIDKKSLEPWESSVVFQDKVFKVDPETGDFYMEDPTGRKVLRLKWEGSKGQIMDGNQTLYRLNKQTMTPAQQLAFNSMAVLQRLSGIYTIKSKNPECYYAYAAERLGTNDPAERLLALERAKDPRPLAFKSEAEWQEFKEDLQKLFKNFDSTDSYIVVLGSSTTFFSVNPSKGDTMALFEGPPKCIEDAKDPKMADRVRTFDTPGADLSDIDINILIPKLSDLCEKASPNSKAMGNDGTRTVYWENSLDKCFDASSDQAIRDMAKDDQEESKWPLHGKAFQEFLAKWTPKLDNREINFSVRILPDERKAPVKTPDAEHDFDQEIAREKFVIPIDAQGEVPPAPAS